MATKARALMYAARPLFNSATPYISSGANNLVCFGSADATRWQTAITANEAVITWATQNGYGIINTGGGVGVPNPNAFDDYGNATSTPSNKEVIQAFKQNDWNNKLFKFYNPTRSNITPQGNTDRYLIDHYGVLTNFVTNYYRADGTDQVWPGQGAANALPYADYAAKMQAMEPRFKADNYAHGIDAWNNPGSTPWTYANCSSGSNHNGGYGLGDGQSTKFYFRAGTRGWFEFPLFRMSEFYLNLAEAYNESGNAVKALQNLNIVHNRAGLPSITITDPTQLRKIIQREWAVEFYNENKRYFDVKHWKLADIGNGVLGGSMREFQFVLVPGQTNDRLPQNLQSYYDQVTYSA
ncbi:MAG: RagB/SusD family nutrient uptake outer membrane protein, partial [Hymenobacter sp.]